MHITHSGYSPHTFFSFPPDPINTLASLLVSFPPIFFFFLWSTEFNQGYPHGCGAIHWSMRDSPDEDNDSHSQHPPVLNSSSEKGRDSSTRPSFLRQDLSLTLELEISARPADHEAFKILGSHSAPPARELRAHTSCPAPAMELQAHTSCHLLWEQGPG